jgi:predicted Zn finger-like uncharacterized protein
MAAAGVITCPGCNKRFAAKLDMEGKKVRCPGCRHIFKIIMGDTLAVDFGGDEPGAAAGVRAGRAQKAARAAAEEEDDRAIYGTTPMDLRPRCPGCSNILESDSQIICVICGYNLRTRVLGETIRTAQTKLEDYFVWLLPGIIGFLLLAGLTAFVLWFDVVLPDILGPDFWLGHDSMRSIVTLLTLALMWPCGVLAYKRLIQDPIPPEQILE